MSSRIVSVPSRVSFARSRSFLVRALVSGLLLTASVVPGVMAGPAPGLEGWYPGQPYSQVYAPEHATRVSGRILAVERFRPREGMAEGVRVQVSSGATPVWVHLGPVAFVEVQRVRLAIGDDVLVNGVTVKDGEQAVVIATRVERGGQVLRLREQDGTPAWLDFRPRTAR